MTTTPTASPLIATRNGRRALFAALYFSEGAPIGFIWWYLPTFFRDRGMPVDRITLLIALVGWPWMLKFLWAPMVDSLRNERFSYRGWIVCAQTVMALVLVPLIWLPLEHNVTLAMGLILCHAFAATVQDVAIDAWAIRRTEEHERATISAFMQAGMLGGRWLFGAGLLIVASVIDSRLVIPSLVAAIGVSLVLLLFARDEHEPVVVDDAIDPQHHDRTAIQAFVSHFGKVLARRSTWFAIAFALTGGLAFEAAGAVLGPFLIDRGFTKAQVGTVLSMNIVLMLVGGFAGGLIADRLPRRVAVGAFVIYLALAVAGLGLFDAFGARSFMLTRVGIIGAIYFGIGLFTAASYALFMDVTDPALGGTQFSAFMAMTNGCENLAGVSIGRLIARLGYPPAFIIMAAASLVSLIALPFIRPIRRDETTD